jgi:hypothetical protein
MRGSPLFPALLCFAALLVGNSATATVVWNWSFSSEAGTFTTDGALSDTLSAHTFTITDFHVTASGTPANIGALYTVVQPTEGMIWDGSAPTEFFRESGSLTNGANFKNPANNFQYTLVPGTSLLDNQFELIVATGDLTVTPLVPVVAIVPTLGGAGMALLGLSLAAAGAVALKLARR